MIEYPPWILLVLAGLFAAIAVALLWIIARSRTDAGRFAYSFAVKSKGALPMIELACTNEQKFVGAINPLTATGKPSSVQPGSLVVEVLDGEGTFTLTGENSFELVSQDVVDETPLTAYKISADADLGEGVETISEFVNLTVGQAKAANLGLTFGEPVTK